MSAGEQVQSECVDILWEAQQRRTPCRALTEKHPQLDVDDAYAIQYQTLERRIAGYGHHPRARLVGRKIDITSAAVMQWLKVDQPDFGFLTADMAVPDGGTADFGRLLQPRVEGEVAFVLGGTLAGPGITAAQVLAATDFVVPAIEIIDSRIADWKFHLADTIADNASCGLFVLGSRPTLLRDVDLRLAGMALRKNGEVVSTGAGAACLGHPVNAVTWLANTLGQHGTQLRAGDIILSGALGPVTHVKPGDVVEVDIAWLGGASVTFR